jgi:hypothetical protein
MVRSCGDELIIPMLIDIGAVPSFTETSNVELDALLSTFRKSVFLPAHLSKQHRDLVFGARHKKTLEDEPVNIEISGEDFTLAHVDRTKDIPDATKGLFRAVALMEDKKDWDNLPVLLEGLATAGKQIKLQHWQKLVRLAGKAGRQDTIIECARRVAKTGFALKDQALVRDVLWWIQYKAAKSNWGAKDTKKALAMGEQVSVLLESESHAGSKSVVKSSDPRASPEVVGILLELAVADAKLNEGKDIDGKVKMYAERLVGVIRGDVEVKSALPIPTGDIERNHWLSHVSPILYGMKGAGDILGKSSASSEQLQKSLSLLEKEASRERGLAGEGSLGSWTYDTLVGQKA